MMNAIAVGLLVAALLPYVATVAAKAGGKAYSNREPRVWLAAQEGWRRRANAAQLNTFEALPFFFVAVLFAVYRQADTAVLVGLMTGWLIARMLYIVCYLADRASLRSLVWIAALVLNISILFSRP